MQCTSITRDTARSDVMHDLLTPAHTRSSAPRRALSWPCISWRVTPSGHLYPPYRTWTNTGAHLLQPTNPSVRRFVAHMIVIAHLPLTVSLASRPVARRRPSTVQQPQRLPPPYGHEGPSLARWLSLDVCPCEPLLCGCAAVPRGSRRWLCGAQLLGRRERGRAPAAELERLPAVCPPHEPELSSRITSLCATRRSKTAERSDLVCSWRQHWSMARRVHSPSSRPPQRKSYACIA